MVPRFHVVARHAQFSHVVFIGEASCTCLVLRYLGQAIQTSCYTARSKLSRTQTQLSFLLFTVLLAFNVAMAFDLSVLFDLLDIVDLLYTL